MISTYSVVVWLQMFGADVQAHHIALLSHRDRQDLHRVALEQPRKIWVS